MDTPLWPAGSPPAPWMSLQEMVARGVVPSSGELLALLQQLGALTSATLIQTGQGLTGGPITGAAEIRLADIPSKHVLANMGAVTSAPVPTSVDGLGWVRSEREVRAGTGLEGGGDLEEDRELRLRAVYPPGTGARPIVDVFGRVTELRPLQTDDVVQPLGAPPTYGPATVADLRLYQGPASAAFLRSIALLHDGLGGNFAVDPSDESTADDGKNVIVDGRNRRWKRISPGWLSPRPGATVRSLEQKIAEVELSVEDFWLAIDADDTNAINRAIAAVPTDGGTVVFNRAFERIYNISAAIQVTRGNISFRAKHRGIVTINSTSTTANHFTIGAVGSAYIYNVHLSDLTFTRSSVSSAGWVIDATNLGYSTVENLRVYGDNKQYQGLRFRSVTNISVDRILTENIQKEAGYFGGLSAGKSVVDGNVINVNVNRWYNSGCHATSSSLATQGALVLGDFVEGFFIERYGSDSHKGYALYLKGTLLNRVSNTLIKINRLDVESGQPGSGALRVDAYTNVFVSWEWVSGKDLNAIYLSTDAQKINLLGGQVAVAYVAQEAACLYCDGQFIRVMADLIGYSTNAHGSGVSLGPNVQYFDYIGGSISQLSYGILVDNAALMGRSISFFGVRCTGNVSDTFNLVTTPNDLVIICPGLPSCTPSSDFYVGGTPITAPLRTIYNPSNVNGVQIFGGVPGAFPLFVARSGAIPPEANVGMNFRTRGTGNLGFSRNGGGTPQDTLTLLGALQAPGETALVITYHDGTSHVHKQIVLGVPDSGGAGFRSLRVPN